MVDYLNPFLWFDGTIIEPTMLLILFCIGMPILMLLVLFLIEVRNSKKSLILYFETENLLNSLLTKIKDGRIFLGKKQISVDKASTLHMRTGFLFKSYKPVYVIKHNLALPLHFTKAGIKVYTGENLKHLVENKTLEQLLKPKGADRAIILWLVLGVVIGVMAGILLAGFLPKEQAATAAAPVAGMIMNRSRG
jgi:hypothetical protein